MSDWIEDLDPEDRSQWDDFVEHFRREALEMVAGSDFFISLVPDHTGDVKFWTELGCGIMHDKPILAVLQPGRKVPKKLRAIADEVVCADIDTEEGRRMVVEAIDRMRDLGS